MPAGVGVVTNPYREMMIGQCLQQYRWYCVQSFLPVFVRAEDADDADAKDADAGDTLEERRRRSPKAVYWLTQRHGGRPLPEWAPDAEEEARFAVHQQLRRVADTLRAQGVAHGQMTPRNVLVDGRGVAQGVLSSRVT